MDLLPAILGSRKDRGGFEAGKDRPLRRVAGIQVEGEDCRVTVEVNPGVEDLVIEYGRLTCEGHQVFLDGTVLDLVRQLSQRKRRRRFL